MRQIMFRIDTDNANIDRPGFKVDNEPRWNGFDVVYVTADTLQSFVTDNVGEIMWEDEDAVIRWPADWGADDDLLYVVYTNHGPLYSLHGWCAEIVHKHAYREDVKDMWCKECDTVTDYCTQINP